MAKRKKSKVSKVVTEYRRIRRNFLARVRAWSKRGFIFSDDVIPAIPKKITQGSINRLNKVNKNLEKYQKAYVDFNTGELFTPQEGRKRYRQDRKLYQGGGYEEAPQASKIIIENFYELISSYVYGSPWKGRQTDRRDFAVAWLNDAITRWGENRVANMLEQGKANGNWLSTREAYDAIKLQNSLRSMASTLGAPAEEVDAVVDSLWDDYF